MLFLINVSFGISVGIGLYLIGVPNSILWGSWPQSCGFLFPYIGPWVCRCDADWPVAGDLDGLAAASADRRVVCGAGLFSNNVLEPWLYGKHTGVSAAAVLVAAFFWMWLWGPVGLLLATPLTVCLLVVGKHVPQTVISGHSAG